MIPSAALLAQHAAAPVIVRRIFVQTMANAAMGPARANAIRAPQEVARRPVRWSPVPPAFVMAAGLAIIASCFCPMAMCVQPAATAPPAIVQAMAIAAPLRVLVIAIVVRVEPAMSLLPELPAMMLRVVWQAFAMVLARAQQPR